MSVILNIRKTIAYLKRNGLASTASTVSEKMEQKRNNKYSYEAPGNEELDQERGTLFDYQPFISVVVPCYETKPVFLADMILSVEDQTYTNYELVIADASEYNHCNRLVNEMMEVYDNIVYERLDENGGISENTNRLLDMAKGEYIALLDHDDLLTPDALFHMVERLNREKNNGRNPILLYSDEDKTDEYLERYFDGTKKGVINEDMLMSNNYICHLSVFKSEVIKELRFRKEYDGAQDHDILLRTIGYARDHFGAEWKKYFCYVPRVLYHWRCYEGSTAGLASSKTYAYENGRDAISDYIKSRGMTGYVVPMQHNGCYRVEYDDIWTQRKDVGAVGGAIYSKGRISGGAMDLKGKVLYEGLKKGYSGYMFRASLIQEAQAVDIRNISIRKELSGVFKETTGFDWPLNEQQIGSLSNEEAVKKSLAFCNKLRKENITLLYDAGLCPERGQ